MMIKNQLEFPTSHKTEACCLHIVIVMMDIAQISEDEAFRRINSYWRETDFTSDNDFLFHETPDYWAKTIYYEQSNWWDYNQEELTPKKN